MKFIMVLNSSMKTFLNKPLNLLVNETIIEKINKFIG